MYITYYHNLNLTQFAAGIDTFIRNKFGCFTAWADIFSIHEDLKNRWDKAVRQVHEQIVNCPTFDIL